MSWILSFGHWIKKNNKILFYILAPLFVLSAIVAVLSVLQPSTTTNEVNDNTTTFETNYNYKAKITPNILYPKGGTIEVNDAIFTKITSAIPFNLNSIISSDKEVLVKGTYEVDVVVKAGGLWERIYPVENEKSFEVEGTELAAIESAYEIDLNEINSFITQVEEETEIRAEQYTIEVVPAIEGTIHYAGQVMPIPEQEALVFQLNNEEIVLISEASFASVTPFTTTETITNTFNFFNTALPLSNVRIISTVLTLLLLIPITYVYKSVLVTRKRTPTTQVDKINKKYGGRVIPVSQNINTDRKTIITLQSFKSVIQIADEKELPIFCYKGHLDESAVYFIVDGDYLYNYETMRTDLIRSTEKVSESDKAYAKG